MFNYNKKKGFSLIELIVVMGIMAIIILIAVPKFIGYTKEARLTKIKASAKEIESASDRYYLKNDNWPRATEEEDDYYTKDELESYAKEIYDKTGTIINLEEGGHYYDIDYTALKNYVRVPDDSVKYIIQNPVGRVYYLDKLTPEGEKIFNENENNNNDNDNDNDNNNENNNDNENESIFHGLNPEAFDDSFESSTSINKSTNITWSVNLDNKLLRIDILPSAEGTNSYFLIKDKDGKNLSFFDINSNGYISKKILGQSIYEVFSIIVPEGANSIYLNTGTKKLNIKDISLLKNISNDINFSLEPNKNSAALNWDSNNSNFDKLYIFRDNIYKHYINYNNVNHFIDYDLASDTLYNYDILLIKDNLEYSWTKNLKLETLDRDIVWSGLSNLAFDGFSTTYEKISSTKNITWEGNLIEKSIFIDILPSTTGSGAYFSFKDSSGKNLTFYDDKNTAYTKIELGYSTYKIYKITIPKEASYIYIYPGSKTLEVKDIYETSLFE